jgi:hypothetical protein
MTAIIGLGVAGLAFLALFLFGRKAGKDAVKAKTSEKTIETINAVNRPIAADERERLWAENAARFGVRDDSKP